MLLLIQIPERLSFQIAKKVFPSFDKQPKKVQILLVSLTYNLGEGGIQKFKKFRAAIELRDYKRAAKELKDSAWYKQVGKRGPKYVSILENINGK